MRQAIILANANGTTSTDYIHFNLGITTRAGRTITLASELPALTSNMVIDGSTQTGAPFGVSEARVILLINTIQKAYFNFFEFHHADNIQLYGLYLFNEVFTIFSPYFPVYGVKFSNSTNIIVGKPGKGNFFRGLRKGLVSQLLHYDDQYKPNSASITIQSNVFNGTEDGHPTIANPNGGPIIDPMELAIEFMNAKDVIVGGMTKAEGNYFSTEMVRIETLHSGDNGKIIVSNNAFGTGPARSVSTYSPPYCTIRLGGYNSDADYSVSVKENIINGTVLLVRLVKPFVIQGNVLSYNNGNGNWGNMDYRPKIVIEGCKGTGLIGGELDADQNHISVRSPIMYENGYSALPTGSIQVDMSPGVRITRNLTTCTGFNGSTIQVATIGSPHIQIDFTREGFVRGKATPGCEIEVFKDDECVACDGTVLLGRTESAADSSWNFSGNFSGVVIATATDKSGTTSGYTEPIALPTKPPKVIHPSCGMKNGSITGLDFISTTSVEWHHNYWDDATWSDSIISRTSELKGVGAGKYYYVAKLGTTCQSTFYHFTLYDNTPVIDESAVEITHPSCGKSNGSIERIYVANGNNTNYLHTIYKWINETGNTISSGNPGYLIQLTDAPPGKYRLVVVDTLTNCSDTSAWLSLVNRSGSWLETSKLTVSAAKCGQANGNIMNLILKDQQGDVFVQWTDSLNNVVGSRLDLVSQRAGNYTLKIKDEGGCDTLTLQVNIPSAGLITIDESKVILVPSGCISPSGKIFNIEVKGATSLEWKSLADNSSVGKTADISDLPAGKYRLAASNNSGCTLQSSILTVPSAGFASILPLQPAITDASCNKNNGLIQIKGFGNEKALRKYHWINSSSNENLGSGLSLTGLPQGIYELIATDTNSCTQSIFKAVIETKPIPAIEMNRSEFKDDQCSLNLGSITGAQVSGLLGPTNYAWINSEGVTVSQSLNLDNAGAGLYKLVVTDNTDCIVESGPYELKNKDHFAAEPVYEDLTIARHSSTNLVVKNFERGTYELFADAGGLSLLEANQTGIFKTPVIVADTYYYVRYRTGSCVSAMTAVKISVVDKSLFTIASAFTPNGDGLNDRLNLRVAGFIEVEYFRIFNRNGEQIFHTRILNTGWDGNYKGTEQPSGSYVWFARGKDITGKTVEGKGSFILIR